jgi:hypothetical protein
LNPIPTVTSARASPAIATSVLASDSDRPIVARSSEPVAT